jgi:hypothetical protein
MLYRNPTATVAVVVPVVLLDLLLGVAQRTLPNTEAQGEIKRPSPI